MVSLDKIRNFFRKFISIKYIFFYTIFIAVLAVYELINGQTGLAFWLALAFGIGRLAHAIGFSSNTGSHLVDVKGGRKVFIAMRVIGAMSTFFTFIVLGGALVYSMSGLA